jgi:hypothetical protein
VDRLVRTPFEVGQLPGRGVDVRLGSGHAGDRNQRRIARPMPVVTRGVRDFLNWMTLFGIGLIVGGAGLLIFAVRGARQASPRTGPRKPPRQPEIRPSALLADTVVLSPVPPPNQPHQVPR